MLVKLFFVAVFFAFLGAAWYFLGWASRIEDEIDEIPENPLLLIPGAIFILVALFSAVCFFVSPDKHQSPNVSAPAGIFIFCP